MITILCLHALLPIIAFDTSELQIVEHPKSMVCDFQTQVTLSVSAVGPETLLYKWKKDGVDINDEDYTGINESSLSIRSFSLKHKGMYSCRVKHNEKSAESDPAELELSECTLFHSIMHLLSKFMKILCFALIKSLCRFSDNRAATRKLNFK